MRRTSAFVVGLRVFLIFILIRLGGVGIAFGQQTINYASASGHVRDQTDAVVAGAQVIVREIETNLKNTTMTDPEGYFRFPYLKPGPYEITVRDAGFVDAVRPLTLTVGSAVELSILLSLASVETNV